MTAATLPAAAPPSTGLPALPAAPRPALRGIAPDELRLLVARRGDGSLGHRRLRDLPALLRPGDALVVNTSAVVPAAVPARRRDGAAIRVHLSTPLPGGWLLVELREVREPGTVPLPDGEAGEVLALPAGAEIRLLAPHPAGRDHAEPSRLWLAAVDVGGDLHAYLERHGGPVRYAVEGETGDWELADVQTIFATHPGSAESPSAALGFTGRLVARLVSAGVEVVPVVLHTGVSSLEAGEAPYPERYGVTAEAARRVNVARASGGRVIAVGTTVTRALETVADRDGAVHAGRGWTEHVVTPASGVRAIDGLLTGWHEPEASHAELLEAVAGADLLARSYHEAAGAGYLGHQFGDLHLILR